MAALSIEEARKIYKYDELKALMLSKFSKEELEKHAVTQEEFDKTFLDLLGKCIAVCQCTSSQLTICEMTNESKKGSATLPFYYHRDWDAAIASPTAFPRRGGTAFPICVSCAPFPPMNMKLSGND